MSHLHPVTRWILCLLVIASLGVGLPCVAQAASQPGLVADASAPLLGSFLQDVVGNRTRLIQASIIFVLLGIALLFKK